jgi:hypothetical protein
LPSTLLNKDSSKAKKRKKTEALKEEPRELDAGVKPLGMTWLASQGA